MKITLSQYLELKYPQSISWSRVIVSEDGMTITKWDDSYGAQPTPEQIEVDMPAMELVKSKREKMKELQKTDAGIIRVIEDIWTVLKAKNIVTDADLPTTSAAKIQTRKNLRDSIK